MTRALPLPPDERRRAIMDATLPLLLQHGASVSTRQIAEASGIAEGTIFRVFASKSELVEAVIQDALSPDALVASIEALPPAGLSDRVEGLVGVLQDHAHTSRLLLRLLPPTDPQSSECGKDAHREAVDKLAAAVEASLTEVADELAVPVPAAAGATLALSLGSSFSSFAPDGPPPAASVASLLLHGISTH